MVEIITNLFIGDQDDYESSVASQTGWAVVHAYKEPYHRQALGYKTRGAPKDHPEYLMAKRGDCLILNLVDVEDPSYIANEIIDNALNFIYESLSKGMKVIVHCNQGESRAPSIGLSYMAYKGFFPQIDFYQSMNEFKKKYPDYKTAGGFQLYVMNNLDRFKS